MRRCDVIFKINRLANFDSIQKEITVTAILIDRGFLKIKQFIFMCNSLSLHALNKQVLVLGSALKILSFV